MTTQTKSLADLLPAQDHYFLLHDGVKFARHGTPEANGLLVFETLEGADQFHQTVGKAMPAFKPVRVDAEEFMRLVEEVGAVCVADGLKVVIGTLGPLRSRHGTQPELERHPANPEGVVPEDSNWVPADQIPAVVEAQLDDEVLPCGCPVDPLEIEDARASLIEQARIAACDDRDDVCEILEGGPIDSENRSSAGIELRANPAQLTIEGRQFPEYVPDEWDMEMLAWAYLDEGIALEMHSLTTGWSEKYWHRFQRFELIAKHLGESKRREVIDAMDGHQARQRGDDWQVFKASCKPDFWCKPADRAAIVRVAESVLEQLSDDDDAGCYGREYLEILRDARMKQRVNDEHVTAGDADDETSRYEKINCRELRAELDAPNEIDELLRAAADLEHLGLVDDAKRIRESVRDLVRQMRRKWLKHSNYIPWGSDQGWVESSNAIPEELEDHPMLLDGLRALLRDVECLRHRTLSDQTRRSQQPSS